MYYLFRRLNSVAQCNTPALPSRDDAQRGFTSPLDTARSKVLDLPPVSLESGATLEGPIPVDPDLAVLFKQLGFLLEVRREMTRTQLVRSLQNLKVNMVILLVFFCLRLESAFISSNWEGF